MSEYKWKPFTLLVSAEEVKGNEMKIEAGKYYKTRDGRKVGPIKDYEDKIYYKASFSDGKWTYLDNGFWSGGDGDKDGRYLITEWQDEAPSPIRTVTRREIVAGNYGLIQIFDNGCMYIETDSYTADQCREAAHILNQIAEVLEENGE